jgi:hypothetical protein
VVEEARSEGFVMAIRPSGAIAWFLGLLLFTSPLLAGKNDIHVDFDKDFDFSTIHAYAWHQDPLFSLEKDNKYIHDRIVEVVDARFYRAGIKKLESGGDINIAYQVVGEGPRDLVVHTLRGGVPGEWRLFRVQ